jgi:hypothetical protein
MLRRLLNMGIGEVADRSRQEASKWLERKGMSGLPSPRPVDLVSELGGPELRERANGQPASAAARLLGHFQATAPSRFFAGSADALTPSLFAKFAPEARDRTVVRAESVGLGCFDLLGYQGLHFGDPVDWHLDPVSGRRSPLVHWSLIDPTDARSIGDSKVVWELSRQQFLVTLGIAYRATGDEHHAEAFARLVQAWMRANPAGLGINWASSLEAALRIVSWSWALVLFRKSKHLAPDLFVDIVAGIGEHASHVERYLSRYFSPNTHLTGEALGLFYAGILFPESPSATRWRALGQDILEEQVDKQILADGVYVEQTTAYQRYTAEIYLHYLMLAARNGVPVSAAVGERVQRTLDVLLALRRPDGGMPAMGDADGGSLFAAVPRRPDDTRGVFGAAAAFFGRSDYFWAADGVQPEALWLLGPSVIVAFEAQAGAPPRNGSRAFGDGGYVVMRSGWRSDSHHLVFDVGPLGGPTSGAHGHADLLGVQLSPFGEACIVDPGTYTYSADPALRDHFRGTSAHSTVVVDGQGQAESLGPFGWRERPEARLGSFISTTSFDLADASHDAYRRLADPVVHRRRVVFVKSPGYWVIVDDLAGEEDHGIELRFQFAPVPVSVTTDGWVRAALSGGRGLLVRAFAGRPLATRLEEGSNEPLEGWVSPDYGRREPAPILIYGATARLPLRILTLLLPVEDAEAARPAVQPVLDQDHTPIGLVLEDRNETVLFEADAFTIGSPQACKA